MADADVIVVGAGVAGLTVARDLVIGGLKVLVIEESGQVGGKLRSHLVGDLTLDAGAESFATRGDAVENLIRELGATDQIAQTADLSAWLHLSDGSSAPLPRAGLLGIPGTPMAADVIRVVGFRGALRAQLDSFLPGIVGSRARSLGALVRLRMGRRVLDRLVAPVVVGVHSRHPDDIDADTVAPGLRRAVRTRDSLARAVLKLRAAAPAGSRVKGIRGGLFQLADQLRADLQAFSGEVRLDTRVREVTAHSVITESGETFTAGRAVVCSVPDLAETVETTDNPAALITLVTLIVEHPDLDCAPRGTGVLVTPHTPGVQAKALTHATAKWGWLADAVGPHRHVLRLSFANTPNASLELVQQARSDAAVLLGVSIAPQAVRHSAIVSWKSSAASSPTFPEGVHAIGEATAGTGLAAVIAQARHTAVGILSTLTESESQQGDDGEHAH